MGFLHRCVEMLIKEQMRKYKVKMEEISQLEAAESIAFRRLSLLRQNTVSARCGVGLEYGLGRSGPVSGAWVSGQGLTSLTRHNPGHRQPGQGPVPASTK